MEGVKRKRGLYANFCSYQFVRGGIPGSSDCKESACKAGDLGLILGSGEDPLEKEMATHSSILAWDIP